MPLEDGLRRGSGDGKDGGGGGGGGRWLAGTRKGGRPSFRIWLCFSSRTNH